MMVTVLVAAAALQGDAGVFPATPVSPLVVASGGSVVATGRLGAAFLNPAVAASARGLELSIASYPRTGLTGFGVVGAAGGKVGVIAGLWSFSFKDLFDPELVAQDPALSQLTVSAAAASLGLGIRWGHLKTGLLYTVQSQTVIGTATSSSSWSIGTLVQLWKLEFGSSLIALPTSSHRVSQAPDRTLAFAVAAAVGDTSRVGVRLELDVLMPQEHGHQTTYGCAPRIRYGPFEVLFGYASDRGWSAGAGLLYGRWRVDAGSNFVNGGRLDHRVAIGLTYR